LGNFKNKSLRVLIATDIAARGIDVDDLGYVFNYDISNESETYVHRIGRTGRA
jgi:ATP-dependent RNA helicase RhlE